MFATSGILDLLALVKPKTLVYTFENICLSIHVDKVLANMIISLKMKTCAAEYKKASGYHP